MLANYHTHTTLCGHAVGDEREYVENAIKAGIKILGFADHSPQIFTDGFVSSIRMRPDQTPAYVEKIRRLGEEYKQDITLYVGFEVEYFPAFFPALRDFGRELGVDYFIMGQHYLFHEKGGVWVALPDPDEKRLTDYVDQVLEGLATGAFTYLAHPDMIQYTGDEAHFRTEMTRLCQGAKALDVPLEVNMLGLADHRHYPSERFYRIAAEVGNAIIVGCDAHNPAALLDVESQKKTRAFAEQFGLYVMDTVPFRKL